jgi:hypothetical protein
MNTTRESQTLRDYFAAAALQGLLAHEGLALSPVAMAGAAKKAFMAADMMMESRQVDAGEFAFHPSTLPGQD